jgi:hypothetical protein
VYFEQDLKEGEKWKSTGNKIFRDNKIKECGNEGKNKNQ